jgi:hypothetical protein
MAKKQLPKAQLGAIIKGASKFGKIMSGVAKGAAKGAKTGYKTAIKVETGVKPKSRLRAAAETPRGPGRPKKVQEIPEVIVKPKGTSKGTVKGTVKGNTKSKARLATENVVGKVVGGAPFYTVNALKKFLKSKYGVGIGIGALTYGVANRWNKTNAPKKAKRFKEK